MELLDYIIVIISLFFSFVFSSFETAIISYPIVKAETLSNKNNYGKIIYSMKKDLENTVISVLIWNNLVNVMLSTYVAKIAIEHIGSLGVGIATFFATFLIVTLGEVIPKSIAIKNPEKILMNFSKIVYPTIRIIYPIAILYKELSRRISKSSIKEKYSKEEIIKIVDNGNIDDLEKKIIERLLFLGDLKVSSIKKSIDNYLLVEKSIELKNVVDALRTTSKDKYFVLVYEERVANIVGYLKAEDILRIYPSNPTIKVKDICLSPSYYPMNMKLSDFIKDFIKSGSEIAIIVDEYGDSEGVITLDDLLEEIIGVPDIFSMRKIKGKEIIISGDTNVSDINDTFGIRLEIPKEYGYSTIAGLILEKLGRFPKKGEKIKINNVELEVVDVNSKRINKVKIKII